MTAEAAEGRCRCAAGRVQEKQASGALAILRLLQWTTEPRVCRTHNSQALVGPLCSSSSAAPCRDAGRGSTVTGVAFDLSRPAPLLGSAL